MNDLKLQLTEQQINIIKCIEKVLSNFKYKKENFKDFDEIIKKIEETKDKKYMYDIKISFDYTNKTNIIVSYMHTIRRCNELFATPTDECTRLEFCDRKPIFIKPIDHANIFLKMVKHPTFYGVESYDYTLAVQHNDLTTIGKLIANTLKEMLKIVIKE